MGLKRRGLGSNKTRHKPVLLLNADYSILVPITLKRAINLFSVGKARFLKTKGDRRIHPNMDLKGLPVVAILTQYAKVPHREIPITRRNILLRDNFTCQYTDEVLNDRSASIDHVIPKSRKGSPGNTWSNLVACTKKVNNYKADQTPEEAGLKLKSHPHKPTWSELIVKHKSEWTEFMNDLKAGKVY